MANTLISISKNINVGDEIEKYVLIMNLVNIFYVHVDSCIMNLDIRYTNMIAYV